MEESVEDKPGEWMTVKDFAAIYKPHRRTKVGVSRQYIFSMVDREVAKPKTTDIDVMIRNDSPILVRLNPKRAHRLAAERSQRRQARLAAIGSRPVGRPKTNQPKDL